MRNKKGWIRIVEAFVAIILIASFLLVLYNKIPVKYKSEAVYNLEKAILEEVSSNSTLRQEVLNNEAGKIENFVSARIPANFNFTIKICEIEDICSLQKYKEEVYSSEKIISSTLEEYKPRKLKIFMWRER